MVIEFTTESALKIFEGHAPEEGMEWYFTNIGRISKYKEDDGTKVLAVHPG